MVKIIWTNPSIDDLKSIHKFISIDSLKYADQQIDRILSRTEQLSLFPNSGRIIPETDDPKLREIIEGSYRIFYKVSPEKITILRIHHSSKNIDT